MQVASTVEQDGGSLQRHSSRRASLYETFLKPRLSGATRYDRIAGYFQSSLLELASESLAAIPRVRILCNAEVAAADVKTVRMATGARRKELEEGLLRLAWNAGHFTHLVEVHGHPAQQSLKVLHALLMASGQDGRLFEIRRFRPRAKTPLLFPSAADSPSIVESIEVIQDGERGFFTGRAAPSG